MYTPSVGVPMIWDAGMKLFLTHMIKPPIQEHVISAILNQIHIDREGYAINRSAVKSCVDVLLRLRYESDGMSVYQRIVEPGILRESKAFYTEEGTKLVETCDAPEFLRRVRELFLHWILQPLSM